MNDSSTPLEELLVKLIRFFKSYTVDIISFDTILLIDTKPESTMRLFDDLYMLFKYSGPKEYLRWSYGDVIKHINAEIHDKDDMILSDQLFHDVYLRLGMKGSCYNHMLLKDYIFSVTKTIAMRENFDLFDLVLVRSYINANEKFKLREAKRWISNLYLREESMHMRDTVTVSWEE